MANKIVFHLDAWREVAKQVVETEGVARMQRVASAANQAAGITDGYRVSVEGPGERLQKHEYRATVITATGAAMRAEAEHGSLVGNFYQAGG